MISVAELDRRLRRAVEGSSVGEWVEGEVTSMRVAGSGHLYFTLKDELEEACIDCVIYRSAALRARRVIRDGAKIQIWGQATVWAPRGRLQFIGERVRAAGRGALLEALEQLKLKLQAEGLFSAERKRALPAKPRFVGVVTSLHGAAIHDIREVSSQRGRVVLVLSPAVVQGEAAAGSIVNALALVDKDPRVEVVIIGRGGGSSDDLMAFNDEQVVRRIAAMRVPTVSAVGHEVDVTLADLVADVRAATPSHAAELVVSDDSQAIARLREGKIRLVRAMRVRLQEDRSTSEHLRMRLSDPRFLIAERQQLLDELRWRAERVITRVRGSQRSRLEQLLQRLAVRHPRAVIASSKSRLLPLQSRLLTRMRLQLAQQRAALGRLGAGLDALSPLTVLSRGYSIATLDDGHIVRAADQLRIGDEFNLKLLASALRARVVGAKLVGKG
ncbi:MAG TPA: exodeoxyribonuclease VII large subunit [Polyangiaceae bacterium]|nr:exodeoxyribonuclease VII large subunit [Polyangiaceae bacterium]